MIKRYTLPGMGELWSEENKFRAWLKVELLACEKLAKDGKIPAKDMSAIKRKAAFDIPRIDEIEKRVHHDVAAFVSSVQEKIGPSGRFIHLGLTSNDVVDTSLCYLMKEAGEKLIEDVNRLMRAVAVKAKKYKRMPIMGRTHGIHAEPVTLGWKFALMYQEFKRARARLERAIKIISVGKLSGVVGTYAHLGPEVEDYVCRKLGLQPATDSTQVIARDRHAEYMAIMAIIAGSLERWATEIRGLQRTEIRELEEPFRRGQKGSSAMPHKRNPVICERICGLARLIRGYAATAQQNIALWHERDISHSSAERVIIPDATTVLDYILAKMTDVVEGLHVYPQAMADNLEKTGGLIFSQRVLLRLIDKGTSRDEAYKIVQDNAMKAWLGKGKFYDLLAKDKRVESKMDKKTLKECFQVEYYLKHIDKIYRKIGL